MRFGTNTIDEFGDGLVQPRTALSPPAAYDRSSTAARCAAAWISFNRGFCGAAASASDNSSFTAMMMTVNSFMMSWATFGDGLIG
jgi:hypothetical protein